MDPVDSNLYVVVHGHMGNLVDRNIVDCNNFEDLIYFRHIDYPVERKSLLDYFFGFYRMNKNLLPL